MGSWWLQCRDQTLQHLQTTQTARDIRHLWSSNGSNKDGGNDYDEGAERLKHNNNKPEKAKKEREGTKRKRGNLLRGSYSVLHPWSMCCLLPPASLFLPYFQRSYPPCQQHASQINRKYTHTYKHTGISASILAPSWREYNTLLLIQSELPPEAIFQSNQKKGLSR